MFLTRVWFLVVALILLNLSPSGATSYLRVNQHGVIYYHFNNRSSAGPDSTPVKPSEETAPVLRKVVPSQGPAPRLNLPLASVLVPNRLLNDPRLVADFSLSQSGPLKPTLGDLPPGAPSSDSQENIGPAKPSFLKILTKLNFFDAPRPTFEEELDPGRIDAHFLVPDVWAKVPKYFQVPSENPIMACVPQSNLLLSNLPPLPKYSYQSRLWGRVVSCDKLKAVSSVYYCFPVGRSFTFRNTWGDPRPGGRMHRAVDIFAPEGTELYAITAGVIQSLSTSSTGGIMLMLQGNDGRGYGYMHLLGYADGIVVGKAVKAGELIGYLGRSGTQNSPPHLHIQVYPDHQFSHETLVDPYDFLVQLCRGIGVSDLNQPRMARQPDSSQLKIARPVNSMLNNRKNKIKWIQVYQRPWPKGMGEHTLKLDLKGSPTVAIRNN